MSEKIERLIEFVFSQYGEATDDDGMSVPDGSLVVRANGGISVEHLGDFRDDNAGIKLSGFDPRYSGHVAAMQEFADAKIDLPPVVRGRVDLLMSMHGDPT